MPSRVEQLVGAGVAFGEKARRKHAGSPQSLATWDRLRPRLARLQRRCQGTTYKKPPTRPCVPGMQSLEAVLGEDMGSSCVLGSPVWWDCSVGWGGVQTTNYNVVCMMGGG